MTPNLERWVYFFLRRNKCQAHVDLLAEAVVALGSCGVAWDMECLEPSELLAHCIPLLGEVK